MKTAPTLSNVSKTAMINTKAKKGQHVRWEVQRGQCIPASKGMLDDFTHLGVLGVPDMEFILTVLPTATFRPTGSGRWCRLNEFDEFKAALAERL